jgi:hypothetical protein
VSGQGGACLAECGALQPADFTIREDGVVRLNPELARRVAPVDRQSLKGQSGLLPFVGEPETELGHGLFVRRGEIAMTDLWTWGRILFWLAGR